MENIKFRQAITDTDGTFRWHYWGYLYTDAFGLPVFINPLGTVEWDKRPSYQFIGLKDEKRTEEYPEGQEIYAGDIIRLSENRYGGKESPIDCVVKWNDKGFYQLWRNGIIHWKIWQEDSYGNVGYRKNWEVIGNTTQTPKLIENSK